MGVSNDVTFHESALYFADDHIKEEQVSEGVLPSREIERATFTSYKLIERESVNLGSAPPLTLAIQQYMHVYQR